MTARYLYIHGFNSSPDSGKALAFVSWCQIHVPHAEVVVPDVSHDPRLALQQLEAIAEAAPLDLIVGSSLGGYYGTWLSEKYNAPAVLVNPAVAPWLHLSEEFLGWHTNTYSGKRYELTLENVDSLKLLEVSGLEYPENFLVLLQTADEVLDYRLAVDKYKNCKQLVQEGGSHSFDGFADMLPTIMRQARN